VISKHVRIGSDSIVDETKPRTDPSYPYILCGWHTHSEIPLTCVPISIDGVGNPDVMIELASGVSPVQKDRRKFAVQHSVEWSTIRIEDVADFEIRHGRHIRVWPAAGAKQKDIEIFLFGPAWATLCHQRRILPLHASAVVTKKGIAAFLGHSGAGKSTTAALLTSLGYELITDDILPLSFNQKLIPGAWPYLRRLKLHRDAITRLAFSATETVSELLDKEKFFFLPERAADDRWRSLKRVYLLEHNPLDSLVTIERITGADAVRALVDQTYHFNFILGARMHGTHLAACTQVASKIAVFRMRRSLSSYGIKELGGVVCEHLEDPPGDDLCDGD
jgi:hypothetical protein